MSARTKEAAQAARPEVVISDEGSELRRLMSSPCKRELADRWGVEEKAVESILAKSIVSTRDDEPPPSPYEVMAAGVIANKYGLDPMTSEVYFFRSRDGRRIVPIVGVDGWAKIVSRQPGYLGCEFTTVIDADGKCLSMRCRMRKATEAGVAEVEVEEFLSECARNTQPWKSHTRRMLRHKAFQQAARLLFAITGIYDEDDGEVVAGLARADPRGYEEAEGGGVRPMGGKHGAHPDLRHSDRIGPKRAEFVMRSIEDRGLDFGTLVELLAAGEYHPAATDELADWPASLLAGIQKWLDSGRKPAPRKTTAEDAEYWRRKGSDALIDAHDEGGFDAIIDAATCFEAIEARMEGDSDLERARAACDAVKAGAYQWPSGAAPVAAEAT